MSPDSLLASCRVPTPDELPKGRRRGDRRSQRNVAEKISECGGQRIRILLEVDTIFEEVRVRHLDGRQTDFLLIR